MSTHKLLFALSVACALGAGPAVAEGPGLGKNISEADIRAWDIAVLPDGSNLPPGSGTPAQGAAIYAQTMRPLPRRRRQEPSARASPRWSGCRNGIAWTLPRPSPTTSMPTTIFDIVRRGMPFMSPRTLSDDQVYALTAYLLSINNLIGQNDVMDAKSLPKVKMPNAGKFIDPVPGPHLSATPWTKKKGRWIDPPAFFIVNVRNAYRYRVGRISVRHICADGLESQPSPSSGWRKLRPTISTKSSMSTLALGSNE